MKYIICNVADEDIFDKQCEALEKNIPRLDKRDTLRDVDGSIIQLYDRDGKKIKVLCDYIFDEVCIESELELTQFFHKAGTPL